MRTFGARGPALTSGLVLIFLAGSASAQGARSAPIPAPTGSNYVGTTVWHWGDSTRLNELTPDPGDVREIMVQAWYPAAPDTTSDAAPYAPLYRELAHYRSWSYPGAPVASVEGALPVIVITPGRGLARHLYSGIAEDLASHGYLVLGVDSPHSGRAIYPDGRFIPPTASYAIPIEILTGPYHQVDQFFEEAAELGAQDVSFTLERLAEVNRSDPTRRFTGRLDLTRLGLFGHSLGGRIGGAAVGADARFVAFASMEGVPPAALRRGGMDAAVLMLLSSELPDMAQPNIREVIPNRRNDAYVVTLNGFGHNSVTDLPFLDPRRYSYEVEPVAALETTRALLLAFFDEYVQGKTGAMRVTTALERVDAMKYDKP